MLDPLQFYCRILCNGMKTRFRMVMIAHPGPGIGFHKRFMWQIIIPPTPDHYILPHITQRIQAASAFQAGPHFISYPGAVPTLSRLHWTYFPRPQTRCVDPRSILVEQRTMLDEATKVGMRNTDAHICAPSLFSSQRVYIYLTSTGNFPSLEIN